MVKGALWRPWAWLSSIVDFAAVTLVNHQQHANFASSDTPTGRTNSLDAAHLTPTKNREQMFICRRARYDFAVGKLGRDPTSREPKAEYRQQR
jgi:hypothetical protein